MNSVEVLRTEKSWIEKTPGVCGGRACVRTTRLPVWSLVFTRRLGISDEDLLEHFVTPLSWDDLDAAWEYYERHHDEIERDIRENEEA